MPEITPALLQKQCPGVYPIQPQQPQPTTPTPISDIEEDDYDLMNSPLYDHSVEDQHEKSTDSEEYINIPTKRRQSPRKARTPIHLKTPEWPLHDFPWHKIKRDNLLAKEAFTDACIQFEEDLAELESWNRTVSQHTRQLEFTKLAQKYAALIGNRTRIIFQDTWYDVYGEKPPT